MIARNAPVVPNFYILGAPKCGTSAVFRYLSEHPNVFMAIPKEPSYWSFDFPGVRARKPFPLDGLGDYLRLFDRATDKHHVIGEATGHYLASQVAVSKIIQFNSASKFLVMLRNPVEFATSYHHQKIYDLLEDVADFSTAWGLQDQRALGRNIPARCWQPEFLQYRLMGSFGSQIQRLMQYVNAEQIRIILLEDLVAQPRETYLSLLEFLGLDDDGRSVFPHVNAAKTHRFRFLNSIYHCNQGLRGRIVRVLRSSAKRVQPLRQFWRDRVRFKPQSPDGISIEMRKQLRDEFEDEIRLLSSIIDRDLDHWLTVDPMFDGQTSIRRGSTAKVVGHSMTGD